ncbi:denticleless -like protein [Brachionus plicatilis]|uniref:Denticleless-like protein n=1 Tax=Brachionus plicatilis TaxID=10195 RepID=A0A3M7SDU8_BRAPC|nr:denticleless -like protein [Brachionus plicatilis]
MKNLPFTVLKHLHSNYSNFYSNNDNKYEIIDSNRVPYIAKFNKEILNFLTVADENGCIKLFRTFPKLKLTKEIAAQKSCIYDLEWLTSNQLACGGGDQFVSVYDVETSQRIAVLRGHTESVKSVSSIPDNPFIIASGSRDGSVLVFDLRCNKYQPTSEIVTDLGIDPDSTCIRAVNVLNKAHFTQSTSSTPQRSILKSKASNINSPSVQNQLKKSSPVACVLYQNDHHLISAGVTDGLIKIWDTRKIYSHSSKKLTDPNPVYAFDYQTDSASKKGFSSLAFNSTRTNLYSNCMNNCLYESNMVTYDANHVRVVNEALRPQIHKNFHLNNSNFIKSSLSQCDNFIVTGSSDFNAYIYSTNQNSGQACFRKYMPVIALKGHTNEVTTVDWNPFDPNQIVTCSDDNSIRLWNVKNDLDLIESKEFNFLKSEIIDEFTNVEDNLSELPEKLDENYISGVLFNRNLYNKYRPHFTTVFDDCLFIKFEQEHFLRKPKALLNRLNLDEMDFEEELCLRYESINIDKVNTNDKSSGSHNNSMICTSEFFNDLNETRENSFKKLKSILSDLPVNLVPENFVSRTKNEDDSEVKKFSSVFSTLCKSQSAAKPRIIKRKTGKTRRSQDSPEESMCQSNILMNLNRTPISCKKRSIYSTIIGEKSEPEHLKTPKTKKRLLMSECLNSSEENNQSNSHAPKTILDYFFVKQHD